VIKVQEWAEIRHLHFSEGLSARAIAARLGLARETVARALRAESPPRYSRAPAGSAFDVVEPSVRVLLARFPSMPATVLAERVAWAGSASWFRKQVALLRPEYAPKDPADRLSYRPGDQAQCDLWFPPARIPVGGGQACSPPVLVVVACFSRCITARMLPSRTTPDLLAGIWWLLEQQLGAVPRRLVWDNEAGIGRGGHLADGVAGFSGTLATKIVQLKPFDPESKGIVERANGYLETSFLPGRRFSSPADFNRQLAEWLPIANRRTIRSLDARPVELVEADRAAMLPLPPIAPTLGHRSRVRLGRDYYVRVAGNDYSVDPTMIGRMVEINAGLEEVLVTADSRQWARHLRVWATRLTVTDPVHVEAAARLRTAFGKTKPRPDDDLLRDLADYDRAFGVDLNAEADRGGEVA
jgi:transcriptional regulator with XRE-family HTH domain